MLTYGSFFSGIAGFELGFDKAGLICKWQVESHPDRRKVLMAHYPNVKRDVIDVRHAGKHNLEAVDVVCGGFPCQDVSVANTSGNGLAGQKSGLWWEYHRAISELRPKYAVVENVSNLTARGFGELLGSLAEIGYNAEWETLSAAMFGLPHLRKRLFIVAYPDSQYVDGYEIFDRASIETFAAQSRQRLSNWLSRRVTDGQGNRRIRRIPNPGICRAYDGVPGRVDRYEGLGNAVVPIIAALIARLILRHSNKRMNTEYLAAPSGEVEAAEKTN